MKKAIIGIVLLVGIVATYASIDIAADSIHAAFFQ